MDDEAPLATAAQLSENFAARAVSERVLSGTQGVVAKRRKLLTKPKLDNLPPEILLGIANFVSDPRQFSDGMETTGGSMFECSNELVKRLRFYPKEGRFAPHHKFARALAELRTSFNRTREKMGELGREGDSVHFVSKLTAIFAKLMTERPLYSCCGGMGLTAFVHHRRRRIIQIVYDSDGDYDSDDGDDSDG
jgi:hypothetical protein